MGSHLYVFPKEIWEMIMDQVENSKDVISVLRGIPQLDITIDKKKRFWFIDQVLSLLFEYLELKNIFDLRLICRQWQIRIDNFLKNQPCLRAYSHELRYHVENPNFYSFRDYSLKLYAESITKLDLQRGLALIAQILNHPQARSPFIFGTLRIVFDCHDKSKRANVQKYLNKLEELLNKFGRYVRYLEIKAVFSTCHSEDFYLPNGIGQTVVRILQKVPKLRKLSLTCSSRYVEFTDENQILRQHRKQFQIQESDLPDLPFLESLEVSEYPERFNLGRLLAIISKRYSAQIRRLDMSLTFLKKHGLTEIFPNLTELSMEVYTHSENWIVEEDLRNMLTSVHLPKLCSLRIYFECETEKEFVFSIEDDILKWLKRFPSIKYFEIASDSILKNKLTLEEKLRADPGEDTISSLQYLNLVDGLGLSYNFLRCFPSLKHIEIQFDCTPSVVDLSMPDSFVKLREEIQTMELYGSNIWGFLPKLKKCYLTPYGSDYKITNYYKEYLFFRDTYEKWKKTSLISTVPQKLNNFRQDILDFLYLSSRKHEQFLFQDDEADDILNSDEENELVDGIEEEILSSIPSDSESESNNEWENEDGFDDSNSDSDENEQQQLLQN